MSFIPVQKILKSTDDVEIFALAVGNGENPSLVFVHGLASSGSVFDDLFRDKDLLDHFYLVYYDMRGHGRSGKPEVEEGYASVKYADDFAAVAKAFHLKAPILIGWSLGGTVACDICAHLGHDAISGIAYVAGVPHMGPIINEIGTPLILGFLPGLFSTDDVLLSQRARIAFVDSMFNEPDTVPISLKWSSLGASILQSPSVCQLVLSREQDPEKLFEAGSRGLPLLVIKGPLDKQVQTDVVVDVVRPHFKDLEVYTVEGGSHTMFYDNQKDFVGTLTGFAFRVFQG
ncbi:alpha/beta-hydrolase, partial [Phlegmacium glaucopus]